MRCNPSYWLLGLVPIALLSWVAVQVEHEGIESDLGRRSDEVLSRTGLAWPVTTFSGRDGVLGGTAADDTEPDRAAALVRSLWGVRVVFPRVQMLQRVERYGWRGTLRSGALSLSGYVPNEDTRQIIKSAAQIQFPGTEISDELKLAGGAPDQQRWLAGIRFGLEQLKQLKTGSADLDGLSLSIAGEAATVPAFKSVKQALKTALPGGIRLASEKVTPPVIQPFVWSARQQGGQLLLGGYAPADAIRDRVFGYAKGAFPRVTIVDRSDVAGGATDGFEQAARAGLIQIAALQGGLAAINANELTVSGEAADQSAADAIRKALRSAMPSLFRLNDQIKVKPAVVAAVPPPQPAAPYVMSITADATTVEVGGTVPSDAARAALVDAVRARFPGRSVADRLKVLGGAPEGWQQCIVTGLAALPKLTAGKSVLTDRRLEVTGSTGDFAVSQAIAGDVKASAGQTCETATNVTYTGDAIAALTWRAVRGDDGAVTLDGETPDDGTRGELIETARRLFPDSEINDRMRVGTGPPEPWSGVALRGLEHLARLRRGEARLVQSALTVRGFAASEEVAAELRSAVPRDLPPGFSGTGTITVDAPAPAVAAAPQEPPASPEVAREVDKCQTGLRDAAARGTVTFARASADLTPESNKTLGELASVASGCQSFRIEIEGHTDSEGTDERNQRLSDRRAQAIVDFLTRSGVSAERLKAIGYGATRPIADNESPSGRAKNRRIEFTVKAN